MPAEDYADKLEINATTGEQTSRPYTSEEVAARDALEAVEQARKEIADIRAAYLEDASVEIITELLSTGWLHTTIKPIYRDRSRTPAEKRLDIRAEVETLSGAGQIALLADLLFWVLAAGIIDGTFDSLDDLGGS